MKNNILITSAGQRVSLVRFFQKEIQRLDGENKIYTVDLNPILAPACHVSDGYKKVPRVTEATYISTLLEICNEWNIRLIIPTIDTELLVLSKNKKLLKSNGIIPIISTFDFIETCRDKRLTNSFFISRGVDIPQQYNVENLSFPLFIKPYDGSLSKGIELLEDESQFTEFHLNNPKLMFMEYINPVEHQEFTVDTYYSADGKLKCVVPRQRIFVRAGEVNKSVTRKNEIVSYIKEKLHSIDGAIGCLTMQFFFNIKSKRIIGIEINPRFGGGYPLSYLAGANFPKMIIDEYILNKKIIYSEEWEKNLLMLRYDAEILVHNCLE